MIERLQARLGYVPQERVDEVERALGDARARVEAALVEADRERVRRAVAEDELAALHADPVFSGRGRVAALNARLRDLREVTV